MHLHSALLAVGAILLIGLITWITQRGQPATASDRVRFIQLLLAELDLSQRSLVEQARSTGTVPDALQVELSRAKAVYVERFRGDDPSGIHFHHAVQRWLRQAPRPNRASS